MQEYLYMFFESEGHKGFLEDGSITLINKAATSDIKKTETLRKNTHKILAPCGINTKDVI